MRTPGSVLTTIVFSLAAMLVLTGMGSAQTAASAAAAKEYKRLQNLQVALMKIPMERQDKEPHRSFLKKNDNDIVYSDPAGIWFVRSVRFWDLETKYHDLPIADKIAWTAAQNTLPGECEGYVNCYLSVVKMTDGEYLTRFPKGAYSKRAVDNMIFSLSRLADDAAASKRNFDWPTDNADRPEFLKALEELRTILSKVDRPEKATALTKLKLIEAGAK